jgi:hypothetical protein
MASSSRVSLAWWCWSCAQARHWHSGRSGRIATTTTLQLGEQGAVASFRPERVLPLGTLPVATGNHGAATAAGRAVTGGRTSSDGEVVEGLDRPTRRATSVGGRLERRPRTARLVTHHEFLSSWQREGSLGVLAPVVLTHYRGRHRLGRAARAASREHESCGRARCSSEIWLVHQPASLMRRCQNGPVACFELLVVDGTVYDADVGRRLAGSVDHGRHEGNEPNMHPWCTEDVPGPPASMDRGHREAPAVIVVGQWTGQEASALRQALRMTIPEFASASALPGAPSPSGKPTDPRSSRCR